MKFFIDTGDVGRDPRGARDGPRRRRHHQPVADRQVRPQVSRTSSSRSARSSTARLRRGARDRRTTSMMAEARELAKIHKNVVVKVPLTPDGLKAVRTCASEGIRTNVTLCFSANQALLAAKAGADLHLALHRPARRHRRGRDGADRRDRRRSTRTTTSTTEVLVASVRNPVARRRRRRCSARTSPRSRSA